MRFQNTNAPASGNAIGYDFPDIAGLIGFWNFGGSELASRRNWVDGSLASVTGAVTYADSYAIFDADAGFYTTNIAEPRDVSVLALFKTPDTLADNAHRPVILANDDTAAVADPLRTSQGVSLFVSSATAISFAAARYASGTSSSGALAATLPAGALASWSLLGGRASDTVRRTESVTGNVSATAAASARDPASSLMKIGGGISGYGGVGHLSLLAIVSAAYSDADRDLLAEFMRAVAAGKPTPITGI
ncbi:hypothetical protein ACFQ4O_02135 [Methylopila musalis]|uniref:Uncharacterized protein n=1 Tax=Methylopila musalis TaxID=1134781 RepID=A0ABW3Z3D8_9HYPH